MFKVVALVDISPGTLVHAGDKFNVERAYTNIDDMLAEASDIDLVMIMSANEYHVEHTVKSLRAGKHVFVEKPMALSLSGANEIEEERVQAGKVVFVGTMRRFATAFLRVKDIVSEALAKGEINYGEGGIEGSVGTSSADAVWRGSARSRHYRAQLVFRRREWLIPTQV